MSTSGIKAGKAFVDVSVRDKLDAQLADISTRLKRWGAGLAAVGGALVAGGSAALAAIGGLAKSFADQGSAIYDVAAATGLSTEMVSGLGYAAEQTGASLDDVASGMKGIAKFTGKLAGGSKRAQEAMDELGLSADAWLGAGPQERLAMLSDALARVEDPSLRVAYAMKVLGGAGAALTPMLQEGSTVLNQLLQRAGELGLIFTEEDAARADALGDAWDDLVAAFKAVGYRVGSAVADALRSILEAITPLVVGVGRFIKKNRQLVVVLAAVAAATVGVGVALVVLGGAIYAVGAVLGSVMAIASFASSVMAALASPLGMIAIVAGLVVAALGLATFAFLRFTETGQTLMAGLGQLWQRFSQLALQTLGGIGDALMAGDLRLAAEVAMVGVQAAFAQGWALMKQGWSNFKAYVITLVASIAAESLAAMERTMAGTRIGMETYFRALGLPISVRPGVTAAMVSGSRTVAEGIKIGAETQRQAENAAATKEAQAAQTALDTATAAAKAAREAADVEARARAAELGGAGAGAGNLGGVMGKATAEGTFSSTVAGWLGRALEGTAAERTADATEDMADDLAAIRRQAESGGLVFV